MALLTIPSRRFLARTLTMTVALCGLGGCATSDSANHPAGGGAADPGPGRKMVMSELYFGQAKPKGGFVSPREWQQFLDTEITPRFPDGLTIVEGYGQWLPKDGKLVKEQTRILMIVHAPTREDHARIEAIRQRYQQRFGQELVLKITSSVRASF